MKRRGKKNKVTEKATSEEHSEENGTASSNEDPEPTEKRKKTAPKEKKKAAPVPKKTQATQASKEDKDSDSSSETQYEVQKILDQKTINGERHYLIRWKGYEPESDTWEPASTLNCPELIAEFNKKQKKSKAEDKPIKKKKNKEKKRNESTEEDWDENEDFEVDRILDVYFKKNGQREFLVSWKGYSTLDRSWEPEENMDCKELINKFMEKVEQAKKFEQRQLRVNRAPTDRFTLLPQSKERRLSKRHVGQQR